MPALLVAASTLVPALVAALPRNFGPYATLMLLGFVFGILGNLTRSRLLVGIGVALIIIGAFLLPLALKATTNDEPPPPPAYPPESPASIAAGGTGTGAGEAQAG